MNFVFTFLSSILILFFIIINFCCTVRIAVAAILYLHLILLSRPCKWMRMCLINNLFFGLCHYNVLVTQMGYRGCIALTSKSPSLQIFNCWPLLKKVANLCGGYQLPYFWSNTGYYFVIFQLMFWRTIPISSFFYWTNNLTV